MRAYLGPLNPEGRVPLHQQTRVAAFLISAHAALARHFAFAVPLKLESAWQTELNAQLHREMEIVSLLMRATSWVPDFSLPSRALAWEAAWLPQPVSGIDDPRLAVTVDLAALGHSVHGAIRPAALLPVEASTEDPFAMALRRIEFESSRLIQAQIHFLKGEELKPMRDAVSAAVEGRHRQVRKLWDELLESIGIGRSAESEGTNP